MSTKIPWVKNPDGTPGETWNSIVGCSHAGSPGCDNCYAELMAFRQTKMRPGCEYCQVIDSKGHWNGKTALVESALYKPIHWEKPRTIFVNSMNDLFHPSVSDISRNRILAVVCVSPRHTFQVLTKRSEIMLDFFTRNSTKPRSEKTRWKYRDVIWQVESMLCSHVNSKSPTSKNTKRLILKHMPKEDVWPLPNLWLGVTVEGPGQKHRIDHLRETPAAVRFLSLEPLLEDVGELNLDGIHWVIVGGETGPKARPMHPDWARSVRDQCIQAGIPFFFKQWGEWLPGAHFTHKLQKLDSDSFFSRFYGLDWDPDGTWTDDRQPGWIELDEYEMLSCVSPVYRVGKKRAGRLLDGREWNEMPGPRKETTQ